MRINSGIAHNHYTSITSTFLCNSTRAILTIRPRSPKTHPRKGSSFVHTITRFLHDSCAYHPSLPLTQKSHCSSIVEKITLPIPNAHPQHCVRTAHPIHCIRRAAAHPIPSSTRPDPCTRSNRKTAWSPSIKDTIQSSPTIQGSVHSAECIRSQSTSSQAHPESRSSRSTTPATRHRSPSPWSRTNPRRVQDRKPKCRQPFSTEWVPFQ